MKQFNILLILIFFFGYQANSQELMAETGLSFTSFEFKNSEGKTLNNLQSINTNYISIGYRHSILNNILFGIGGVGINNYGAIGSDDTLNNYFEWETSYLSLFLGIDVKVFKTNKVSFYLRGTSSYEFLLQGTQTLNNQVFDLNEVEEFDSTNVFFRGGLLIEYELSKTLSIFTQYRYGKSTGSESQEDLKYKSHDVGFGLVMNLTKTESIDEKNKK